VFETADRITVLRLGRNVGVFERRQTSQQAVVEAITAGIPTKVAGIPSTAGAEA
jgi:ABC-type sugar transport system ATPase subunit